MIYKVYINNKTCYIKYNHERALWLRKHFLLLSSDAVEKNRVLFMRRRDNNRLQSIDKSRLQEYDELVDDMKSLIDDDDNRGA